MARRWWRTGHDFTAAVFDGHGAMPFAEKTCPK
ncbi:hypothetical protein T08_14857 [Trichinella sp. T8]|nr:hypothetical protein T08_14857 [Trichinella sp. T8]